MHSEINAELRNNPDKMIFPPASPLSLQSPVQPHRHHLSECKKIASISLHLTFVSLLHAFSARHSSPFLASPSSDSDQTSGDDRIQNSFRFPRLLD
jgi:hypothetical protein